MACNRSFQIAAPLALTLLLPLGPGCGPTHYAAPVISSFTATPTTIQTGQSATLAWSATNADTLSIAPGVGTVTGSNTGVSPTATTTYTLTASGRGGTASATAVVNVTNPPPAPAWTGIKQLGVSGHQTFGYSVATDASGNVYVGGYTDGGLDGNTLTGSWDFFVSKYDTSGAKQYTRQLGVSGQQTYGYSAATDASGNVYVAGDTQGGLDGNTLTGIWDSFVTKYNGSGMMQYTRQLGVSGQSTHAVSVATDTDGNVYVTGFTDGGLDGNTVTGSTDFFVTKYNGSGVKQYTRQLGVPALLTEACSVATDTSGNVYVAGYTDGGLDGNTVTGTWDFFVSKYNSSGAKQYTKQLGVPGHSTQAYSVATDASGNVYVAGYTDGGLDGNTVTGSRDFFVTKYNGSGVKQYTKQLGVSGNRANALSVATDASGNVYVAGFTGGGLDGNTLTGIWDFFVSKYDSSGAKQYTRQLGVSGHQTFGYSVATDASGNVYVAGYTDGGLDGNTLTGSWDIFVSKYNGSGVLQ